MKVKSSYVGNVYRAVTQFIDKDDKKTRLYVIVDQKGKRVAVAKLKGIKKFLPDGKNADKALVSIFIIISLIIFVRGILNYDMQGTITNALLFAQLFFGIVVMIYLVIVLKEL